MQINLQGKNMELTEAIKDYVLKKETNLGRLLSKAEENGGEVIISFEVSKNTNHHKSGSIFHADCLINMRGEKFYGSADQEDLHQAIDRVKENLFREISKNKDRRQTLFKRGAASIKKMLKGLSNRNPFTSKY
ncbi:ribosomal subunit interface protein [Candidatus Nomurabacteria bacterium RIFCSPHIGHO2_12_FULL_37_29]|uniref:Ribosomal subunit interface protein n=1 Tax=Candidatus Nomurabacteria bacterium RIFCSPHIGHO2_12_FULL_37_29 TaxID=1801759 RepID=A0A1F6WBU3_9BACT|nr:MAG: ribosomal subunit interface protein [Candidatus Nomurabacteria bacterium RIFCSPHIGHO2_12_FULL_37_29]